MSDPYPYNNPHETDQAVERRLSFEADARFDASLEKPLQENSATDTPEQCGVDVPGRR